MVFRYPLLATECTDFDVGAERMALALARRAGQDLAVVMPLASNAEYEVVAPELADRADRAAAARLDKLRERARAAGVVLDLTVRHGDEPCVEIVDDARARGADLIVIRRRGRRSFLAQLMVGEMVGKVLAHAPCSALVVPRDAQPWQCRVLAAVEADAQGRRVGARAIALAAEAGVPLSVLCVLEGGAARAEADALLAALQRDAAAAGVAAEVEIASGAPAARILEAARRGGADLIVLGARSVAHAARAKLGRVAHEVAGRFDGAVLLEAAA